jgi:hypothetical protein
VGTTIEYVSGLNEPRAPTDPAIAPVDEACFSEDRHELVVRAMHVANGHDTLGGADVAQRFANLRTTPARPAQRGCDGDRQQCGRTDSWDGLSSHGVGRHETRMFGL